MKGMFARSKITGEMPLKSLVLMVMKNRRRYGGYIVHIGIVLITVGIIGSQVFSQEINKRLAIGQRAEIGSYEILYKGLEKTEIQNGTAIYANLAIFKNNKFITSARPEKVFYSNSERPFSEVSIHSTLKEDLYIVLQNWLDGGKIANFMIKINPLVSWMWIGSILLTIGGLLALWPGKGSQLNPKMYEEVSS
jgi:cytochrome c-type biogenesis protein CcmF